jgi:hypothetical protein
VKTHTRWQKPTVPLLTSPGRTLGMPVFEIENKLEYGDFSALIGCEKGIDYGYIRVEPPFTMSEDIFSLMSDRGLKYEHEFTNQDCTAIVFYEDIMGDKNSPEDNLEIVLDATDFLLSILGGISDKIQFMNKWENQ